MLLTPPDGIAVPWWVCCNSQWQASMSEVAVAGPDLATDVFQVHSSDEACKRQCKSLPW